MKQGNSYHVSPSRASKKGIRKALFAIGESAYPAHLCPAGSVRLASKISFGSLTAADSLSPAQQLRYTSACS
jgi:hypothetical protein